MSLRLNRKLTTGVPQLHPIAVKEPWYMIGIDFVGPISPTAVDGSRFILTISDYFTKWVEALSTPDKSASSVATTLFKVSSLCACNVAKTCYTLGMYSCTYSHTLVTNFLQVFMRFGIPQVILSDQGSEFNNTLDTTLCSQPKIFF